MTSFEENILCEYMTKYINNVNFELVHKNNIIICQKWMCLSGLDSSSVTEEHTKKSTNNPNTQFNEYFLENSPIKTLKINNKYWIVDGHHRFFRGFFAGYNYFLVENISGYRPCTNTSTTRLDIFRKRPHDDYDLNNYQKVFSFHETDKEQIIEKIITAFPNIIITRYEELRRNKRRKCRK